MMNYFKIGLLTSLGWHCGTVIVSEICRSDWYQKQLEVITRPKSVSNKSENKNTVIGFRCN